jgi:hypothetical protein
VTFISEIILKRHTKFKEMNKFILFAFFASVCILAIDAKRVTKAPTTVKAKVTQTKGAFQSKQTNPSKNRETEPTKGAFQSKQTDPSKPRETEPTKGAFQSKQTNPSKTRETERTKEAFQSKQTTKRPSQNRPTK